MTDWSVMQMTSLARAPETAHPPRGRPPRPGLRESILQAAEGIFTERDYHEVQMDDVASACGVGKGTLYRYFGGKRDLYLAVMFDGIERLRREIETTLRTAAPPARTIERIVRCTLDFFWDRRRFFALIHQHELRPDRDVEEWFRQRQQLIRMVQQAIDQAIDAGHLRPTDSRIATEMLFGMMRGVNRYRAPDDRIEVLVAAVVDMFMCGIGTPAGRRALSRAEEA